MHSLNMNNTTLIPVFDCSTNFREILRGSSLPQNQRLHLRSKEYSNKNQKYTDSQSSGGIPQTVVGQQSHRHTEKSQDQAKKCARILQQKYRKLRIL